MWVGDAERGRTRAAEAAGPRGGGVVGGGRRASVDLDGGVNDSDKHETGEEADGARDEEERKRDDEHVPHVEHPRHRSRHLQPRRRVVDRVQEQVPAPPPPPVPTRAHTRRETQKPHTPGAGRNQRGRPGQWPRESKRAFTRRPYQGPGALPWRQA